MEKKMKEKAPSNKGKSAKGRGKITWYTGTVKHANELFKKHPVPEELLDKMNIKW